MNNGGMAKIPTGKTAFRTGVLSILTVELINELNSNMDIRKGTLFGFNSSNSLIKNLNRHVKQLKLPKESSIDVTKWQCHNLRVSKCTNLYNEGMKLADIMRVSGHKSIQSLMKYIKSDEEEIMKGQQERNMKLMAKYKRNREGETTEEKPKPKHKRIVKAVRKKKEKEFEGILGKAKNKTV